jgi:hypothetical protein
MGCGKSDAARVEDAIRAREAAHMVRDASCEHVTDRRWRCVLRTANLRDGPGSADTTVVCSVVVGSSAAEIDTYQCRY